MNMMRIVTLSALLAFCMVPSLLADDSAVPAKAEAVVKVGKPAPDFSLPGLHVDPESGVATTDAKRPFKLVDYAGKRPVLLIFSSFT
jgi:hypothetical protein